MKSSSKSASEWVSEFQQGYQAAYRHIFDLYYRSLCYYAGTILTDTGEIEDTVSEVFLRLWQKAADFDNLPSIKGFLYISTKNLCLDRLKQNKRQQSALGDYTYVMEMSAEEDDYSLLETEVLGIVYEEIERLPTKARSIFKLIFFEGLKTGEIAAELGISVKTVRNQKARAVQLLQTALLKKGLPPYIWFFCILLPD